jgi:hypothetical protein
MYLLENVNSKGELRQKSLEEYEAIYNTALPRESGS